MTRNACGTKSKPNAAGYPRAAKTTRAENRLSASLWKRAMWSALIGFFTALPLGSHIAHAATASLCPFMRKVLRDLPNEFANLKGASDDTYHVVPLTYHGRLAPWHGARCSVRVRFYDDASKRKMLAPLYWCTLAGSKSFAAIERRFIAITTDLHICFAGWNLRETKTGSAAKLNASWNLTGSEGNARFKMGLMNVSFGKDPWVTLVLNITDDAPAKPGSKVPVARAK